MVGKWTAMERQASRNTWESEMSPAYQSSPLPVLFYSSPDEPHSKRATAKSAPTRLASAGKQNTCTLAGLSWEDRILCLEDSEGVLVFFFLSFVTVAGITFSKVMTFFQKR